MTVNDWDQPWVLGKMFQRAYIRCNNLAAAERLLGYDDSAKSYRDMAKEFEYLGIWVQQQMYEIPPAA